MGGSRCDWRDAGAFRPRRCTSWHAWFNACQLQRLEEEAAAIQPVGKQALLASCFPSRSFASQVQRGTCVKTSASSSACSSAGCPGCAAGSTPLGRIVMELRADVVPKTAEVRHGPWEVLLCF